jgi:hypothetical protein
VSGLSVSQTALLDTLAHGNIRLGNLSPFLVLDLHLPSSSWRNASSANFSPFLLLVIKTDIQLWEPSRAAHNFGHDRHIPGLSVRVSSPVLTSSLNPARLIQHDARLVAKGVLHEGYTLYCLHFLSSQSHLLQQKSHDSEDHPMYTGKASSTFIVAGATLSVYVTLLIGHCIWSPQVLKYSIGGRVSEYFPRVSRSVSRLRASHPTSYSRQLRWLQVL